MTTLFSQEETCFLCGTTAEFTVIGSTNRFGSPDLDTRPPAMMRQTIPYWIRRCPGCGYCAASLIEGPIDARDLVRSDDYQRQLRDPRFPDLANSFLCAAMIQLSQADWVEAGWSAVKAAWACDDAARPAAAVHCRALAVTHFQTAQDEGFAFAQPGGIEAAILADLLRRSRRFKETQIECDTGLRRASEATVREMLMYQKALAAAGDDGRHTIEEARGQAGKSPLPGHSWS